MRDFVEYGGVAKSGLPCVMSECWLLEVRL